MFHKKKVSIGIPTYNRADMLEHSVLSALKQDYDFLEIIISDNCSTDSTQQVCQALCDKDVRVKYIQQSSNAGASGNFNAVLEQATGDFFMWLGDDDWIDSNYISFCVSLLESDPNCSLVSGMPQYYVNQTKVADGKVFDLLHKSWIMRVIHYYIRVSDNGVFYGVMRLSELKKLRFRNSMGGDWHLIANMASIGTVKMTRSVSVHRALGGATSSYFDIARSLHLPKIQAVFPMLTAASGAWKEVLYKGRLFRQRNIALRFFMANLIFFVVLIKKLFSIKKVFNLFLKNNV